MSELADRSVSALGALHDDLAGRVARFADADLAAVAEHTPDGVGLSGPVSLEQLRRVFPGF